MAGGTDQYISRLFLDYFSNFAKLSSLKRRVKMKIKNAIVISAVVACVGMVSSVGALPIEMTTNGDFETGDLTGWTLFPSASGSQDVTTVNPKSGTYAGEIINLTSGSASLWKQANLYAGFLTPFQEVTVSFDARGSGSPGGIGFAELFSELDGGGVSKAEILGGTPLNINVDPDVWTSFSFTTTLGSIVDGGVTLQLTSTTPADGGATMTMWYDNVSVMGDVVPEPASLAMIGLGGFLILLRRLRFA
jgi:hypothetical protein